MKTKMMRSIVVATTFLTLIVACSKKGDTVDFSKASLLGKWNVASMRETEKDDRGTILSDTTETYFPDSYIDFRNNDSMYNKMYQEATRFKPAHYEYDTSHYKVNGTQLVIYDSYSAKSDTLSITQLTKSQLVIYQKMQDRNLIEYIFTLSR